MKAVDEVEYDVSMPYGFRWLSVRAYVGSRTGGRRHRLDVLFRRSL